MQQTLPASLLTPRISRSVTVQTLKGPETIKDLSEFISREVTTCVKTTRVAHSIPTLPRDYPCTATPTLAPNPLPEVKSRTQRKKLHLEEKKRKMQRRLRHEETLWIVLLRPLRARTRRLTRTIESRSRARFEQTHRRRFEGPRRTHMKATTNRTF